MKVVCVGGGTGLSNLLRGLKKEVGNRVKELSAIVTVADNGGSTGRIRRAYQIPAPGDIRNCLVALSERRRSSRSSFSIGSREESSKDTPLETSSLWH